MNDMTLTSDFSLFLEEDTFWVFALFIKLYTRVVDLGLSFLRVLF